MLKLLLIDILFILLNIRGFSQRVPIIMEFLNDTIISSKSSFKIDVVITNNDSGQKVIYFFKQACIAYNPNYSTAKFSKGITYRIYKNDTVVICKQEKFKKRKISDPPEGGFDRMFKNENRKMEKGEWFCCAGKIKLNKGVNKKRVNLSLCDNLPKGIYQIKFFYNYVKNTPIDYNCIKCYPKIRNFENVFEGNLESDYIVVILI